MPILEPIAPFLALIDRLISLVRERDRRTLRTFTEFIRPLYGDFEPVALDTLKVFRETKSAMMADAIEWRALAMKLESRRNDYLDARHKLRAIIRIYAGKFDDLDVVKLLIKMNLFLTSSAEVDDSWQDRDDQVRSTLPLPEEHRQILVVASPLASLANFARDDDDWVTKLEKEMTPKITEGVRLRVLVVDDAMSAERLKSFQQLVTNELQRLERLWIEVVEAYTNLKHKYTR